MHLFLGNCAHRGFTPLSLGVAVSCKNNQEKTKTTRRITVRELFKDRACVNEHVTENI